MTQHPSEDIPLRREEGQHRLEARIRPGIIAWVHADIRGGCRTLQRCLMCTNFLLMLKHKVLHSTAKSWRVLLATIILISIAHLALDRHRNWFISFLYKRVVLSFALVCIVRIGMYRSHWFVSFASG